MLLTNIFNCVTIIITTNTIKYVIPRGDKMSDDLTKKYGNKKNVKLEMDEEYRKHKDNQKNGHIGFWIDKIDQEEMNTLAHLAEILSKVGVEIQVKHFSEDLNSNLVSFNVDYETFNKTTNRGAGRKKDHKMSERYKECTVSELKMKLDSGMKKIDIIKELGCPGMTFYRILKKIEEDDIFNWEGGQDCSIWLFTS